MFGGMPPSQLWSSRISDRTTNGMPLQPQIRQRTFSQHSRNGGHHSFSKTICPMLVESIRSGPPSARDSKGVLCGKQVCPG